MIDEQIWEEKKKRVNLIIKKSFQKFPVKVIKVNNESKSKEEILKDLKNKNDQLERKLNGKN